RDFLTIPTEGSMAQKSCAVGRITISLISMSAGCSMAQATARATDPAGIAKASYSALTIFEEAASEVLSFSSESTAPGEMIVQPIFSVWVSMRRLSVRARTAALVAQ